MNIKMTTNSQLSATESRNQKQTKETTRIGQNHRNGDHMEGYQWRRAEWGKDMGNKKNN